MGCCCGLSMPTYASTEWCPYVSSVSLGAAPHFVGVWNKHGLEASRATWKVPRRLLDTLLELVPCTPIKHLYSCFYLYCRHSH